MGWPAGLIPFYRIFFYFYSKMCLEFPITNLQIRFIRTYVFKLGDYPYITLREIYALTCGLQPYCRNSQLSVTALYAVPRAVLAPSW